MSDRPTPSSAKKISPLQAARQRLGVTQAEVAEMIGVPVSSYIPWDQGRRRPQDPRVCHAIAEALQTHAEVLWPPEGNPVIGPKLKALREQQAAEHTLARDVDEQAASETRFSQPANEPGAATPGETSGSYGLHRQIEATNRDHARSTPGTRRLGRRRRVLIPAAASIVVVAAAGTAIATTNGEETPTRQTTTATQAVPTAAQRQRAAQQATLADAKDRGDYNAAITAATSLNDATTVAELRTAAGTVVARRASQAAERGDLPLAASRLDRAEDRYGDSPAITSARRRIEQIKDARVKRAAERKRAAKKRAAARARAAAAARRSAPSQRTPAPSSSGSSPTPSTPAPSSPSPSPSPSPAPSTGGSGGGSGGGSSSGGGSKGGGSSSDGAVDPGLY